MKQPLSFQNIILTLQQFWAERGCALLPSLDVESGAGSFHPDTTLRALGPDPFACAFVQACRRPQDGRYGQNPNRFYKHHQFQVVVKPAPENAQELALASLKSVGLDPAQHDMRFVEDNWESPTLGAAGLGYEVWCDGMEVLQFTYFQQMGGFSLKPITLELAYGLERIALFTQDKENAYDLVFSDGPQSITYGDLFWESEQHASIYAFDKANIQDLHARFQMAIQEGQALLKTCDSGEAASGLLGVIPFRAAYERCLHASHVFNTLDARGGISPQERARFIGHVRDLARGCMQAFMDSKKAGQ